MKRLLAALLALIMAGTAAAFATEGETALSGRVAAGEKHAVLLLSDGTCKAFGDNAFGQCDVNDWKNVVSITASARHTVALLENGTCLAVGDNEWGQCDVNEWQNIVAVAAGLSHTVGLKSDGTCVAVGIQAVADSDYYGEDEVVYAPEYNPCDVADWTDITAVAAGHNLTMGLKSDGTVRVTGEDNNITYYEEYEDDKLYTFGVDTWKNVRQIAVGPMDSPLVLMNDGTVDYEGWSTVFNIEEWGMCSVCNPGIDRFINLDSRTISTWTDIVAIYTYGTQECDAAGLCGVTFGLRADGSILMASEDTFGLTRVTEWTDIVDLAVGMGFVIGVRSDGTLLYAGKGQCLMTQMTQLNNLTDLSIFYEGEEGYSYAVGVKKDGTLAVSSDALADYWGDERVDYADEKRDVASVACAPDGFVILHTDGALESDYEGFASLNGLENIQKIVAGGTENHSFALALDASGNVLSAGEINEPWTNARDIAAGKTGAACVYQDGTVAVTGEMAKSVGDVSAWTDIEAVTLGDSHIVGLKKDGTCIASGDNAGGQCEVSAWQNVVSVAAGARHTLALLSDGTCVAVGDETVTYYEDFVESKALDVSAWRDVVAVRACEGLSAGITKDGALLLAGMGTVDLSAVQAYDLWDGVRSRGDAPLDADSENALDIKKRIADAKADYAAVEAFVSGRGAPAQAIREAHPEYDDVWGEYKGLILYKQDGLYGFLTPDGEIALKAEYDYIDRRPEGGMYVVSNENGYGFADLTGTLRVPCQYGSTDGYDAYGYARVMTEETTSRKEAPYIDRDGNVFAANEAAYKKLIADLPAPEEPVVNFVSTGDESDHYDDLEGYLDPATGETVYPLFFDTAYNFADGIAKIYLVNNEGYINERFELLTEIEMPEP